MSDETPRENASYRPVNTPRDAEGNPDWNALSNPGVPGAEGEPDKPVGNPLMQAQNEGAAAQPPVDFDSVDGLDAEPLDTGGGSAGATADPPDDGGGSGPDDGPDGNPDDAYPADQDPLDGPVFYTQRGLEQITGASMRSFPDMNAERGPEGMPRSLAEQLIVPVQESIRVRQPDGREQTLEPSETPFAVRDVRGRIHALSTDEYNALLEQGQKIEANQGAAGGPQQVSLLAGGVAALVNALRGDQSKKENAKAAKALEAANAAAAERRRYEPWWTSRAQADVSTANEHIAKATDLGRKIRSHPDVRDSVDALREAKKRTMLEPNDIDAWMDYRKASRDISRNIANNPELSDDLQAMRGHLDQTESAVKSAVEAADEAKGQDYAMRDALQGLDTKGLEEATEHLRTQTNDGRSDSGEDTEEQVERLRELAKSVQAAMSNLVNRIMRLGKGQDSGPEPAA